MNLLDGIRATVTATLCAVVLPIAIGCGSTGQKRQTKSAADVVSSAVQHRSTASFSNEPRLAVGGVLGTPETTVAPVALQVGAMNVFVHEAPDVRSKVLGQLKRGDAVRKVAERDYIVPPISSKMDDLDGKQNPAVLAIWSRVQCAGGVTGWVPTRALVLPEFYATSSQERLRELKRNRAGASSQGMVEKRKAKLFVGKGFGSEQDLQEPNPAKAREIVGSVASAPPRFDQLPDDYFAPTPSPAAPAVGVQLATLDPAAEARAAQVRADMASIEGGKGSSSVSSLMALAGVEDQNAKVAAKIAQVIDIILKPRAPTPVEESGLGELAVAVVIGKSKVRPQADPVSAYVTNVGMRIAANCSNPYPATGYRFAVVDYPAPNAIATPGGVILISTGMLKFLKSEDELACVLAHEIAHVEERQAMLSEDVDDFAAVSDLTLMGPDFLKEVIEDSLEGSDLSPELRKLVVDGAASQLSAWMKGAIQDLGTEMWRQAADPGQSDECAADIRGIALAAASGYDIGAMDSILARINQIIGSYGGANYADTRPADVAAVRAVLPKVPPPGANAARGERWSRLQGML